MLILVMWSSCCVCVLYSLFFWVIWSSCGFPAILTVQPVFQVARFPRRRSRRPQPGWRDGASQGVFCPQCLCEGVPLCLASSGCFVLPWVDLFHAAAFACSDLRYRLGSLVLPWKTRRANTALLTNILRFWRHHVEALVVTLKIDLSHYCKWTTAGKEWLL